MNQNKDFSFKLSNLLDKDDIQFDVPMKEHTYFKIGGPVDTLVTPTSYEQVANIVKLCNENNVPFYLLGNGSNMLIKDGGIRGVVIKFTKLNNIKLNENKIIAQAGALLKDVTNIALENSLTGFEFACGIPGSIGGAAAMNAGAYDGEMRCIVEKVLIIDKQCNMREMSKEELNFRHRCSAILENEYVVLEVTCSLEKGDYKAIKNKINDFNSKRSEKQPLEFPSAGSTFKRPQGYYTAKLIEDCGLKGYSIGDAQVSKKHSGFIINKGNASAKEVLKLIKFVQSTIKEKYNVDIDTEVRIIGED